MESGASAEIGGRGQRRRRGHLAVHGRQHDAEFGRRADRGPRLPAAAPHAEAGIRRAGVLQRLLLRYTQALITQMTQTAACNRHHSLDSSCAAGCC